MHGIVLVIWSINMSFYIVNVGTGREQAFNALKDMENLV